MKPDTEDNEFGAQGEPVVRELGAEERPDVPNDLRAVEFIENDRQPGRYVEHDDKYIWLTVERQFRPYGEDQ